jgi:5-methylcytosine-specific restriction protein A
VEVHHRLPVSRGGSHDEGNLLTLCVGCHRGVHEPR